MNMDNINEIVNKLHTIISEAKVSNREFIEMKDFLENGGILQNEAVPYHVLIRKDGQMVFMVGEKYKFFKNKDAFIRAAVRLQKRGF